jgi:hypothetical protein
MPVSWADAFLLHPLDGVFGGSSKSPAVSGFVVADLIESPTDEITLNSLFCS